MKLDKYAVFCMFGMVLAVFSLVFGILGKGIVAGSFGLATGGVCFAMLLLTKMPDDKPQGDAEDSDEPELDLLWPRCRGMRDAAEPVLRHSLRPKLYLARLR